MAGRGNNFLSQKISADRAKYLLKMMNATAKPRINGEHIVNYKGQAVCALGRLKSVQSNGVSFVMTLSDGVDIEVFLDEPTDKHLEGMIEVVGEVGSNGYQLQCHALRPLGDVDFDMNLYNEAVKLTHQYPEFYHVGGPEDDSQGSMNV